MIELIFQESCAKPVSRCYTAALLAVTSDTQDGTESILLSKYYIVFATQP